MNFNRVEEGFINRVRSGKKQRIIFPESADARVLKAAAQLTADNLLDVVLAGDADEIRPQADTIHVDLSGIEIIDITESMIDSFGTEFIKIRAEQGKKVNEAVAKKMMSNPLFAAAMLLRQGEVDTMVAGAVNTTANVARAALSIIGLMPGRKTLNSSFLMISSRDFIGVEGAVFFADSGVIPEPTAEQMVEIAQATAETAALLLETTPRVAFLSFSTYGSAGHPLIDKVRKAAQLCKEQYPELLSDGELQGDAALIRDVAAIKCPASPLQGRANVLVFPDLNAGNICYKLVERIGGVRALGPLLQNVAIPMSDLSRGCDVESIYLVSVLCALRAGRLQSLDT